MRALLSRIRGIARALDRLRYRHSLFATVTKAPRTCFREWTIPRDRNIRMMHAVRSRRQTSTDSASAGRDMPAIANFSLLESLLPAATIGDRSRLRDNFRCRMNAASLSRIGGSSVARIRRLADSRLSATVLLHFARAPEFSAPLEN